MSEFRAFISFILLISGHNNTTTGNIYSLWYKVKKIMDVFKQYVPGGPIQSDFCQNWTNKLYSRQVK